MTRDVHTPLPAMSSDEILDLIAGEWIERAACTWTPEHDIDSIDDEDMRLICSSCPVDADCLAYGILIGATHYIFGGLDSTERRAHDNGQRFSICSAPNCGRGFIWNHRPRAQAPGVCETCNSTVRLSTNYSYGGAT